MKIVLPIIIIAVVAGVVAAILWTRRTLPKKDEGISPDQAANQIEFQVEMRKRLLQGSPTELGIAPKTIRKGVWGVLMEIGYPQGIATVVCLCDGSTSLYLGRGGGIIGGQSHENVRTAGAKLLDLAGSYVQTMSKAEICPMPANGRVRFHIMTSSGVFTVEEDEQVLGEGTHRLSALFHAGHEVITQLRRSTEGDSKGTERQQTMLKLYLRKNDTVTAYHEAWINGSKVIEHWGQLGERGQTCEHPRNENVANNEALKHVLAEPLSKGYRPIEVNDYAVLLIEYRIDGVGIGENLDKRHALEDRMNETLGWTGLGHCDGGSIGSGTMEVCCFVVDFDTAKRVITKDLKGTQFADYSRIYLENAN